MSETYLPNRKGWPLISISPNAKLGYIEKVSTGGTPSTKSEEFWDGDIDWLTPKEINSLAPRLYISQTERKITQLGSKTSSAKPHPIGCVMLSKRAPVGLVAINTIPMATNQGFLTFRCGEKLKPAYLAYWLRVNKKYLDSFSNGSTYQELYISDLKFIKMSVPSIEEQEKILDLINGIEMMLSIYSAREVFAQDVSEILDYHRHILGHEDIRHHTYGLLLSGVLDASEFGR